MTLLLALLLSALQTPAPSPASPARGSEAVLKVDEEPVQRADFERWLLSRYGEPLARIYADHWLVAREARRLGLEDVAEAAKTACEAEIKERVTKAWSGDKSKWLDELRSANRTPEGRRAERVVDLERDLRLKGIAGDGRVVPEEKIERDWRLTYGPDGRRYRVRLLFRRLTMPPMTELQRSEQGQERERLEQKLKDELTALRERALAGEPFPGLVRDHSEDSATRATGGRPGNGFLDPSGWSKEALDAVAALPPGGISAPLFSHGGFWLVQLEELLATPLASVQDELRAALVARGPESDELSAAMARLREGMAVEILPALFADAGPADEAVLKIDGTDVGRAELTRWLVRSRGDASARPFAEELHIEKLTAKAGIEPTEQEIEARLEYDLTQAIDYNFKGDRERWEREVLGADGTLDAWRRNALQNARSDQRVAAHFVRTREVNDDLLRQIWTGRYGAGGISLHLRMIRVDAVAPELPDDTPDEERERRGAEAIEVARKTALEAAQRAREGEDFATLAKRFSSDEPTRANGGELPVGFDHASLPSPVFAAIEALSPGETTPVVTAGLSFYVVELLGRNEVPFDSVKDTLRAELLAATPNLMEVRSHRNVLTRDVKVEVLPSLFE